MDTLQRHINTVESIDEKILDYYSMHSTGLLHQHILDKPYQFDPREYMIVKSLQHVVCTDLACGYQVTECDLETANLFLEKRRKGFSEPKKFNFTDCAPVNYQPPGDKGQSSNPTTGGETPPYPPNSPAQSSCPEGYELRLKRVVTGYGSQRQVAYQWECVKVNFGDPSGTGTNVSRQSPLMTPVVVEASDVPEGELPKTPTGSCPGSTTLKIVKYQEFGEDGITILTKYRYECR